MESILMSVESKMDIYSVRRLLNTDKDPVLSIWREGRAFLFENGVSQWQKGDYPGEDAFYEDVREERGRVVMRGDEIVGVFAFTLTPEPSYTTLDGSWLTDEGEYLTIHRSAVKRESMGKGVMSYILSYCLDKAREEGKKSVRIDTHKDNISMNKALEKNNFDNRGTIILLSGSEEGDERLGYERLVDSL